MPKGLKKYESRFISLIQVDESGNIMNINAEFCLIYFNIFYIDVTVPKIQSTLIENRFETLKTAETKANFYGRNINRFYEVII